MRVGIPTEIKNNENRVAITQAGVFELKRRGHDVFVQAGAGLGSAITDADYEAAGATIVATADHNTPTDHWDKAEGTAAIDDPISRLQVETLDSNIKAFGARAYFPFKDQGQGIVHVMGPEQGATLPGMTVVCGDSHTSTHGALGALARVAEVDELAARVA